jgi:ribulose-phosphate 3-epimerase
MSVVCPTITTNNAHIFRSQIEQVESFAKRIHIDLADGEFTNSLIKPEAVWWPEHLTADIHMMYEHPLYEVGELIRLKPHMVIIHAEAEGRFFEIAESLHTAGIKVGVALLPPTKVDLIRPAIHLIDHVLIFSGDLGHFGGKANYELIDKINEVKEIKPSVEIGWDGGINDTNIAELAGAGVDVLNVGGFIQKSHDPKNAYATLVKALRESS